MGKYSSKTYETDINKINKLIYFVLELFLYFIEYFTYIFYQIYITSYLYTFFIPPFYITHVYSL